MVVWIVEERAYKKDFFGIQTLNFTDPVYLASTKEKAIKFIYDHREDEENVWSDLSVEVAVYEMSVDKFDYVPLSNDGSKFYDCRTINEWCERYDSD